MSKKKGQWSFNLKNHMNGRIGKTKSGTSPIFKLLGSTYGFGQETIDAALHGDTRALQKLGEIGRQGRIVEQLMPGVVDNALSAIKGTEEYNKGLSKIAIAGAKSKTNINKAQKDALIATHAYKHDQELLINEYNQQLQSENIRFQNAQQYAALKHNIDLFLTDVEQQYRLLEQTNRPAIKQLSETERYGMAIAQHYLQHGEQAVPELITQKQYLIQSNRSPVESIRQKVKGFSDSLLSAIGIK